MIGGDRFVGKKLVQRLVDDGQQVTVLNRGNHEDVFEGKLERIKCDRRYPDELHAALDGKTWQTVYDLACYDGTVAREATDIVKGKVGKYIFVSSQSVYSSYGVQSENEYEPKDHVFSKVADPIEDYAGE